MHDALHRIAESAAALIAQVEAWSEINSGSYEAAGLARMAAALEPALARLPGQVSRTPLPPTLRIKADGAAQPIDHGDAVRLRVRPDAPVQIALTGHYDTVFPAASPFQRPQRLPDGRLNGPGVADMKGGIAVMLAALEAFETKPQAQALGYEVLLSPDEEIGSPASAPLLAELGARARLGLTYEPGLPDGALVDARKGSGNFHVLVRGRSAHVGRAFAEGRNALAAAARMASRLDGLNGVRDGVTINIAALDGGAPLNQVPDLAVLRFNVRAPDPDGMAWIEAQIAAAHAELTQAEGLHAEVHGGVTRPPKPLSPALHALCGFAYEAGADLGLDLQFRPTGGVCEGNNLTAAGCPTLDTLGPVGGGLHTPDEYAVIDSYAERAKLSFLLLHGLASGRFDLRRLAS